MADTSDAHLAQTIELLRQDPTNESAFRSVEGRLIQTGNWKKLAEVSELVADGIPDGEQRYGLYLKAGRLYEEKVQASEAAARCYDKAASVSAGDADGLHLLLQVRRAQRNYPLLVVAISNHVARLRSTRRRVEMLIESAAVRRELLNDPAGATSDLQRALEEDPNYPGFLDAAESVFDEDKRAFCEFLETLAATSQDEVTRGTALQRALALYRDPLKDLDAAVRVQGEILGDARPGTPAFMELLALFKEAERWDAYADGLEQQRIALEQRPQVAREELRPLLEELGEVYDRHFTHSAKAADVYQALLRLEHDDAVEQRLQELLAANGRWEDLVALHVRAAERERNEPDRWRQHTLTAARLCEEELKSPERATELYEQILTRDHTDADALEALCRVLETRERWADLAVMCVRFAAVLRQRGDADTARTYIDGAASVYEFRLGKPAAAAELYEQILESDPSDELVADSLVRVRRAINDPRQLAGALGRFAAITAEPEAKRDALLEGGQILMNHVGDLAQAETCFREALEVESDYVPAWRALQEALRRFGNSAQLLEALDAERDLLDDPMRVAEIHREAAALLEGLGQVEEATARWESAREISPGHIPTLRELLRLYRAGDEPAHVADVLHALADCDLPSKELARVLFDLAQLIERTDKEGRPVATQAELAAAEGDPALKYARRASELDPQLLDAVTYLRARAEHASDHEETTALLQREAALHPSDKEKGRLLHRAALLQRTELDDEERAARLDAAALAAHPQLIDAARPLADWYFREHHWEQARELFHRFGAPALALENTPVGRSESYYRFGVTCRRLKDDDEALLQLQQAIEEHPQHLDALEMLAEMYRARADWAQARDAYLAILYIALERMDTAKQADVNFTLARIAEAQDGREEAIQRYKKVIAVDPTHAKAARCLVRLYTEGGRWADAVQAYEVLLPSAKNDEERCEIYLAQGELLGGALEDWEQAVEAFTHAVETREDRTDAREALARALRKAERNSEAAEQYERLAHDDSLRVDQRIEHFLTTAEILEEVGDAEGAIRSYEGARELDPRQPDALGALAKLYEEGAHWQPLGEVLVATADYLRSDRKNAKAELLLRAARVFADRLDDRDAAAAQLRRALEARPDHTSSLEKFAEIMVDQPRFDDDALTVHHQLLVQDPLRTASLLRLAQAYARHGYPSRAATLAELLHVLRPATLALPGEDLSPPNALGKTLDRQLDEADREKLYHPCEHEPLTELLRLVDPYAAKLFPPNMEAWDVQPQTETTQPTHIRGLTDSIAHFFGVGRPVIYVAPRSDFPFGLECTDPPTLIAGQALLAADRAETAYVLSRVWLHVAAGRRLFVRLSPNAFERLILTVVAFLVGQQTAPALRERAGARPEDFTLLKRTLPRKVQRQGKTLALEAFDLLTDDLDGTLRGWRHELELTADRAALLVTGDVRGTLERIVGQPLDENRATEQMTQSARGFALAEYMTSRTFLELQESIA